MSLARTESPVVRRSLIGIALFYLILFIFLPLFIVFATALQKGIAVLF